MINSLHDCKTKLAYQGFDFETDRPFLYRCIRKAMAKIYSTDEPSTFGHLDISRPVAPIEDLHFFYKNAEIYFSELQFS